MLYSFEGAHPVIHPTAFVAKEATIIGNVTIGPDAAIFPGVVIRGDVGAIHIGARTNVQDGSVIHVQTDTENVIGEDVTIGHLAMIHGERIGNGTLIGMGATVLAYSTIGAGCIIGVGRWSLRARRSRTPPSPPVSPPRFAATSAQTSAPG